MSHYFFIKIKSKRKPWFMSGHVHFPPQFHLLYHSSFQLPIICPTIQCAFLQILWEPLTQMSILARSLFRIPPYLPSPPSSVPGPGPGPWPNSSPHQPIGSPLLASQSPPQMWHTSPGMVSRSLGPWIGHQVLWFPVHVLRGCGEWGMGEGRGQGGFESSRSGGPSQGKKECAGAGERRRLLEAIRGCHSPHRFPLCLLLACQRGKEREMASVLNSKGSANP